MEHQEREDRLLGISKLIRAKGIIKDFTNQSLLPAIAEKIQEAYEDALKLRSIVKIANQMENIKDRETPNEKYKRLTNNYFKDHLIEDIEEAIKFLTSQCNLLNTRRSVVSVMDDLDRATMLFKIETMNIAFVHSDKDLQEYLRHTEKFPEDLRLIKELEDLTLNEELTEDLSQADKLQEDLRRNEKLQAPLDLSQNDEFQAPLDLSQNKELQAPLNLGQNEGLQEDLIQSKESQVPLDLSQNEELQEDLSQNEELQEDLFQYKELQVPLDLSRNKE